MLTYRFKHWLLQWRQDDEGNIVFVVAGIVGFTKYKEHTIISWRPKFKAAGKYHGARNE